MVEVSTHLSSLLAELKQCGKRKDLQRGRAVHFLAFREGKPNKYISTALIHMYGKCGSMLDAKLVFDNMAYHDVVSWTSLIMGYVENGESLITLDMFTEMNVRKNSVTYIAALKAYSSLATGENLERQFCLEKGKEIHIQAKDQKLDTDLILASNLVDMYAKCGSMTLAKAVFSTMTHRNAVAWTSLILGYVDHGNFCLAIDLLMNMDCEPDAFTFVVALKAYSALASETRLENQFWLAKGTAVHKEAQERGFVSDIYVANALLDMYSKVGSMIHAQALFDSMPHRDVVSWTSLMLGYVENGFNTVAIHLFSNMDCQPNFVTFIVALKACGNASEVTAGRRIHSHIRKLGLDSRNTLLANSLVDFYGKCGMMAAAQEVFDGMHSKDIVSWTALITGYSSAGESSQVFSLVERMQEGGVQPNRVTFLSILTACSHAGLVEDAVKYFESMPSFGITPAMEHYACMADILGRANTPIYLEPPTFDMVRDRTY